MTDPASLHTVRTGVFTTTAGQYLSSLLGLWLPRYGWTLALPPAVAFLIGWWLTDPRFYLVALMVLFIVIPMALSFLYTYYMLTPEARRAVMPRSVVAEPGKGIEIIYEAIATAEDADDQITVPEPVTETIPWQEVSDVVFRPSCILYILATERLQFVMVPYSAIIR